MFVGQGKTLSHYCSFFFFFTTVPFPLLYMYANVCCTLYTSHLMFVHLGGLMDSNGMFNQKSCFHLYRCRGLICHTHVAPKFSHAGSHELASAAGRTATRTHSHTPKNWVSAAPLNQQMSCVVSRGYGGYWQWTSSTGEGVVCLITRAAFQFHNWLNSLLSSTRLIWHRGLARGSVCERVRI